MIGDSYDFRSERELREQVEDNERLLDRLDEMTDAECEELFDWNVKETRQAVIEELRYLNGRLEEMELENRKYEMNSLDPAFGSWEEVNGMFYKRI